MRMDIPGYLSTEKAAERLGVNPQSIYNFANRSPDFPKPVKVGRTSLWPIDGLDSWRTRHPARKGSSGGET